MTNNDERKKRAKIYHINIYQWDKNYTKENIIKFYSAVFSSKFVLSDIILRE